MSLSFSHAHSQGNGTTEVVAVLIAITNNKARVLTVDCGKLLPNGPLMPLHKSLQAGVRQWVEEQTQQPLGYIEQLYTFVDTNRRNKDGHALVYVSYMGLVQEAAIQKDSVLDTVGIKSLGEDHPDSQNEERDDDHNPNHQLGSQHQAGKLDVLDKKKQTNSLNDKSNNNKSSNLDSHANPNSVVNTNAVWRDWYDYFPWENHLEQPLNHNVQLIIEQLKLWADSAKSLKIRKKREQRIYLCWGGTWEENQFDKVIATQSSSAKEMYSNWVAEHALLRYEMLYEAGLLQESPEYNVTALPENWQVVIGEPMYYDHRRVIATAISRLRAKIEYRPLIFGLMPEQFTLLQLQQSVEALSGVKLHKQNFRRLLDSQNLLEPTGNSSHTGRGRPAKLFRFRYDVELQSLLMDSKLPKNKTKP